MPVFEAHVRSLKVDEEIAWVGTRCCAGGAVRQELGWRRLIDAVVAQMAGMVSVVV